VEGEAALQSTPLTAWYFTLNVHGKRMKPAHMLLLVTARCSTAIYRHPASVSHHSVLLAHICWYVVLAAFVATDMPPALLHLPSIRTPTSPSSGCQTCLTSTCQTPSLR
jgi:hypothetical protein